MILIDLFFFIAFLVLSMKCNYEMEMWGRQFATPEVFSILPSDTKRFLVNLEQRQLSISFGISKVYSAKIQFPGLHKKRCTHAHLCSPRALFFLLIYNHVFPHLF